MEQWEALPKRGKLESPRKRRDPHAFRHKFLGLPKIEGISVGQLEANSITARLIDVSQLNALAAKLGDLTVSGTLTVSDTDTVESEGFVAGSTGWQVKGTGDAEFHDVKVYGTLYANYIAGTLTMTTNGILRTAASGQRIELSNSGYDQIRFYTGIGSYYGLIQGEAHQLAIYGPLPNSASFYLTDAGMFGCAGSDGTFAVMDGSFIVQAGVDNEERFEIVSGGAINLKDGNEVARIRVGVAGVISMNIDGTMREVKAAATVPAGKKILYLE